MDASAQPTCPPQLNLQDFPILQRTIDCTYSNLVPQKFQTSRLPYDRTCQATKYYLRFHLPYFDRKPTLDVFSCNTGLVLISVQECSYLFYIQHPAKDVKADCQSKENDLSA